MEAAMSPARTEIGRLELEAHGLADRLPDLVIEASRVASTVAHGIHGRRRAGPGETFWQFRQFEGADAATLIDWRRSASSDQLYVREREWEAAHTVWLWPDLSPSMDFRSDLAPVTKRDRAVVLMLAAAELLVRGGERVALLGLGRPTASRKAATVIAANVLTNVSSPLLTTSLPPKIRLPRYSGAILISDFLDPLDQLGPRLEEMAGAGVSGHLVQVMDPAEETLPYEGRAEFLGPEVAGERWIVDRVETMRDAYIKRLAAHRDGLAEIARRLGWSLLVHHTDRPPHELLLSLILRLGGQTGSYRMSTPPAAAAAGGPA
ncbi:MAG: hypothetical protein ABS54_05720 [Hyphomicrobium sp. SCN 65-11]|nr:MAG: hypothetical protein ABS54_05720 [Hyphomicrobium sp. SCN 65-11]